MEKHPELAKDFDSLRRELDLPLILHCLLHYPSL